MYSHTKKVGPAGRFRSRYGRKIRETITEIESQYKNKRLLCPFCNYLSVKRVAYGIWECGKCGKKLAGKAYTI